MTIVATLITPISADFKSMTLLSWFASSYLIASAASQPLAGKLTDIFGRRSGLILSNVCFGAGCLMCGLSQNEVVMIAGRALSGVGGGGLNAISTFVCSDLLPLRRRGLWQGIGNIIFGVGMSSGGLVGGFLNDSLNWRYAFILQLPLIIVSGVAIAFLVNIPVKEAEVSALKRVDFLGAGLLTCSLVLLLVGLNSGGNQVPWSHPLVLTVLPLSAVFMASFAYVEDKVAPEPIIPVRLLLQRTVFSACITNLLSMMTTYVYTYYIPYFIQMKGGSATEAGLRLIPHAVAISVGSFTSGLAMQLTGRYYITSCTGMGSYVLGAALILSLTFSSPEWQTYVYMVPAGMGLGTMLTVTLVAMIAAVDHKDQAVITSASYAFRSTGSTVGISIASAAFQNWLNRALMQALGELADKDEVVKAIRDDYHQIGALPTSELRHKAIVSYEGAFRAAFLTALATVALGSVASLFMKEHTLHKTLARK
jgi:MFS family permease